MKEYKLTYGQMRGLMQLTLDIFKLDPVPDDILRLAEDLYGWSWVALPWVPDRWKITGPLEDILSWVEAEIHEVLEMHTWDTVFKKIPIRSFCGRIPVKIENGVDVTHKDDLVYIISEATERVRPRHHDDKISDKTKPSVYERDYTYTDVFNYVPYPAPKQVEPLLSYFTKAAYNTYKDVSKGPQSGQDHHRQLHEFYNAFFEAKLDEERKKVLFEHEEQVNWGNPATRWDGYGIDTFRLFAPAQMLSNYVRGAKTAFPRTPGRKSNVYVQYTPQAVEKDRPEFFKQDWATLIALETSKSYKSPATFAMLLTGVFLYTKGYAVTRLLSAS